MSQANKNLFEDIDALYQEHVVNKELPVSKGIPSSNEASYAVSELTTDPETIESEDNKSSQSSIQGKKTHFLNIVIIAANWFLSIFYIGAVLVNNWFVFGSIEATTNDTILNANFYQGQKLGLWKVIGFNDDKSRVFRLLFGSDAGSEAKTQGYLMTWWLIGHGIQSVRIMLIMSLIVTMSCNLGQTLLIWLRVELGSRSPPFARIRLVCAIWHFIICAIWFNFMSAPFSCDDDIMTGFTQKPSERRHNCLQLYQLIALGHFGVAFNFFIALTFIFLILSIFEFSVEKYI